MPHRPPTQPASPESVPNANAVLVCVAAAYGEHFAVDAFPLAVALWNDCFAGNAQQRQLVFALDFGLTKHVKPKAVRLCFADVNWKLILDLQQSVVPACAALSHSADGVASPRMHCSTQAACHFRLNEMAF